MLILKMYLGFTHIFFKVKYNNEFWRTGPTWNTSVVSLYCFDLRPVFCSWEFSSFFCRFSQNSHTWSSWEPLQVNSTGSPSYLWKEEPGPNLDFALPHTCFRHPSSLSLPELKCLKPQLVLSVRSASPGMPCQNSPKFYTEYTEQFTQSDSSPNPALGQYLGSQQQENRMCMNNSHDNCVSGGQPDGSRPTCLQSLQWLNSVNMLPSPFYRWGNRDLSSEVLESGVKPRWIYLWLSQAKLHLKLRASLLSQVICKLIDSIAYRPERG